MQRASRKLEHLSLALKIEQTNIQGFQDVNFVHQALPEVDIAETSISTVVGGLYLSSPIIINAMTGGAIETEKINEQLATIAKEKDLAMAVGSQMSALKNREVTSSYKIIRKVNPNGIVFANLGAEASVKQAKEAIDMLEANALQIHLNVIQELIMPEGDRNFRGALERIAAIKEQINVPLIVKEVGFGIARETASKLAAVGVSIIDVGGKGGTNFAEIENKRRKTPLNIFNDWGINTATSILEIKEIPDIEIIATGGIQNSLQLAKAIGLGANAVGIAGIIIKKLLTENIDATIDYITSIHQEIRIIMTSLGAKDLLDLQKLPMVTLGDIKDWCELRDININNLARRTIES